MCFLGVSIFVFILVIGIPYLVTCDHKYLLLNTDLSMPLLSLLWLVSLDDLSESEKKIEQTINLLINSRRLQLHIVLQHS